MDGYDYEQHLRPIRGQVIPVERSVEVVLPSEQQSANNNNSSNNVLTQEGKYNVLNKSISHISSEWELLEALDNADEFDPLPDDFVVTAGQDGPSKIIDDSTMEDLMWGGFVPQLPFFERRRSSEREALDQLLAETRNLESDQEEEEEEMKIKEVDLDAVLAEEYNEDDIGEVRSLGVEKLLKLQ